MTSPSLAQIEGALGDCTPDMNSLYARCAEATPNYGVSLEDFKAALRKAVDKYLVDHAKGTAPTTGEIREFLNELQASDLFLALACAQGNENAWWDFDHGYRPYIERIARHLSSVLKAVRQSGSKIKVEGYAQSNARVSALMRNLGASPYLENPELVEIKAVNLNQNPNQRVNEFTMIISIKRNKGDDGKSARKADAKPAGSK